MSLSAIVLTPLLVVHIASGFFALLSGLGAMASRKGSDGLHARAGNIFYIAMSAMAISAAILTAWEPDRLSLGAAFWALYLVHTSRHAASARNGALGSPPPALIAIGLAAAILFLHGGVMAQLSPDGVFEGSDSVGYFIFGAGATASLLLDFSLRLRGRLSPRQRIARHLWRMSVAYFLAVTSLFLGQQDDVFPFMAGSPVLVLPTLLTLGFLVFWIVRVRFARNWLGHSPVPQPKILPRKHRKHPHDRPNQSRTMDRYRYSHRICARHRFEFLPSTDDAHRHWPNGPFCGRCGPAGTY